jgi:hypothetical protein
MIKVEFRRTSPMTGKENAQVFEVDPDKLVQWKFNEMLIQEAFPHLSADDREFILTGILPDEWDAIMG